MLHLIYSSRYCFQPAVLQAVLHSEALFTIYTIKWSRNLQVINETTKTAISLSGDRFFGIRSSFTCNGFTCKLWAMCDENRHDFVTMRTASKGLPIMVELWFLMAINGKVCFISPLNVGSVRVAGVHDELGRGENSGVLPEMPAHYLCVPANQQLSRIIEWPTHEHR